MKEFKLSEKVLRDIAPANQDYILLKDVKEFIRLIKEEIHSIIKNVNNNKFSMPEKTIIRIENEFSRFIFKLDKLAGDDLLK